MITGRKENKEISLNGFFWEICLLDQVWPPNGKKVLTASVVVVDLFVWVDLDGGSQWDGWHMPLQLGAHHQVVMFIDSFKLLFYAESLATRVEDHLGLPEKHTACKGSNGQNVSLGAKLQLRTELLQKTTLVLANNAEPILVAGLLQCKCPANDSSEGGQRLQGGAQVFVDAANGHICPSIVSYYIRMQVMVGEIHGFGGVPDKHLARHLAIHPLGLSLETKKSFLLYFCYHRSERRIMLNLTFCDAVLPISVKTRPTVAAVAVGIIPAVCKSRAPVPVVGACLRIVSKHC